MFLKTVFQSLGEIMFSFGNYMKLLPEHCQ